MTAAQAPGRPAPLWPLWPLWVLALAVALPEVVLTGADLGLWGNAAWRPLSWQWAGFWAGLWHGWQPNYAAQPATMLASYSFLHTGPMHLLGNLLGLWWLARLLLPDVGVRGVLALWVAGVVGGGVAFGVLPTAAGPMIGASGAVYGLAGGWAALDTARRPEGRLARGLVLAAAGVAVNLLMQVTTPGGIAWVTHVGGALAGVAVAVLWRK